MVEEARELGANAIVEVRFSTSEVMNAAAELLGYGKAVLYLWSDTTQSYEAYGSAGSAAAPPRVGAAPRRIRRPGRGRRQPPAFSW